jgi:hypothetical protein
MNSQLKSTCILFLLSVLFTTTQFKGVAQSMFKSKAFGVKLYYPDNTHSPQKAVKHSAIIPGLGQLYNRKWWKVPVIYTGLGLLSSAIIHNRQHYNQYLTIYGYYINPDKAKPGAAQYDLYKRFKRSGIPQASIESMVNGYNRNFQLSILGVAGGWGLQMVDAYIDAKFIQSFSVDDNLSLKLSRGAMPQPVVYAGNYSNIGMPVLKVTLSL